MAVNYQALLFQVNDMKRQINSMMRVGTVEKVSADKLRVNFGRDNKGKKVTSGWIHHSNHRGESRGRMAFDDTQGSGGGGGQGGGGGGPGGGGGGGGQGGQGEWGQQTVTCFCPGGDIKQAFVMPNAPNKGHPPPDHANKSGKGEETWQFKEMRMSRAKDSYDYWIEEEQQQQQGGGGGQGGGGQGGQQQRKAGPGQMRQFINKGAGVGGQHTAGKSWFHAAEQGVHIKQDDQHVCVSKEDKQVIVKSKLNPVVNKPWEIADKKTPIKEYSSSGGSGTA